MNILITGAKGMVGTALYNNLVNIKDKKNTTRANIEIDEIYQYDIDSSIEQLDYYCLKADFIFNLAGVNRPKENEEFKENYNFAQKLLDLLIKHNNKATIMLSSSIQATCIGRYNNEYGKSKKIGEDLFFEYSQRENVKVAVYRFPNIMGHSKPNYNSAVSTFCYAIANDKEYVINDPNCELELLYIDDLIDGMLDLLENKEIHCEYEGLNPIINNNGKFCYIPLTHKETLGSIINMLLEFKKQPQTLLMPKMPNGSFAKKLYSLYLTYLPIDSIKYSLKMNVDNRGSFTELLHTKDCGQISVNVSKPGIIKGQHWHNSKWEIFIVVSGHALIQERNINTGEIIEFKVSGDKIEAIYMIPGWTHNIINLSNSQDLVTIMFANESFDKNKPDTFAEKV